jgi:hypothetical protein
MTKLLSEESYFGSEKENNDVQEFIQSNTRCDIIDLLTSYVKSLSSKWQLLWPTALPAVFILAYDCMRYVCNTHSYGIKECVLEKVNTTCPKAIITDLDSQFYMEVLILTFHNF